MRPDKKRPCASWSEGAGKLLAAQDKIRKGKTLIFVLFEATVKKEYLQDYLALAAGLKDELVRSDGFVRSERFAGLSSEGKLLSLSVCKNEDAVAKWRNALAGTVGDAITPKTAAPLHKKTCTARRRRCGGVK